MSGTKTLQHYLEMRYEIRVLQNGGTFVLGIPELGLRTRGTDMLTAYGELLAKKDELLTELVNEGLESWIVPPGALPGGASAMGCGPAQPAPLGAQLRPFFVKLAVVIGLLAVLGIAIGNVVSSVGRGIDRDFAKIRTWPDDKMEQMRRNTHDTLVKLKPILDEVRAALADQKADQNADHKAGQKQADVPAKQP